MAFEIERKFLVNIPLWEALEKPAGQIYCQGYIYSDADKTIRVRTNGAHAYLTIKGKTTGATRSEYEYAIPLQDAENLLDEFCQNLIRKTRYVIPFGKHTWEVDVFDGENKGLIVAEIELTDENEFFDLPPWVTEEVTADARYYNAHLVAHPFSAW